jgi:hypothetical protein
MEMNHEAVLTSSRPRSAVVYTWLASRLCDYLTEKDKTAMMSQPLCILLKLHITVDPLASADVQS